MTANDWQKKFEDLWKQAFDSKIPEVKLYHTNFGRRQVLVENTGPVELKPEIKDENGLTIQGSRHIKNNDWGLKNFSPYKVEYYYVWRKTEKGLWDLYEPMYKVDRENGKQYTVYQEAPKEFLTGEN